MLFRSNGINGTNGVDGTNGVNGTNGLISLVKSRAATSVECPSGGGTVIQSGLDLNSNGDLESSEITSFDYACNGIAGINGTNGVNGINGVTESMELMELAVCLVYLF